MKELARGLDSVKPALYTPRLTQHASGIIFASCLFALSLFAATTGTNFPSLVGSLGRKEALEFEGNRTFTADQIYDALRARIDFLVAAHPDAPLEGYLDALQKHVRAGYLRRGFPTVQVTPKLDPARGRIRVSITEGPRYKTGKVLFEGVKAVADKRVQQRLVEALGGMPAPGVDTGGTNLNLALWKSGEYVPFDEAAAQDFNDRLVNMLASLNYYRPRLNVRIVPEHSSKQADLIVKMLDEGLKGTLDSFELHYPTSEKKNTDAELLQFLELKPGMPFRATLLNDLTNRLWTSGRFFRHDITLTPLPEVGHFKLEFQLDDLEQAPPLRQTLSTNETGFLNLCRWLNNLDQHQEDLLISLSNPVEGMGTLKSELALSKSGFALAFWTTASNAPPRLAFGLVLSEKILGLYSGWRAHKLVIPGSFSIRLMLTLLPVLDADEPPGKYSLCLGAGFASKDNDKAIDWTLNLAPSKFLALAHTEGATYSLHGGTLTARLKPKDEPVWEAKIEPATGRLLEATGEFQTNAFRCEIGVRSETGAFAGLVSKLSNLTAHATNDYHPQFPVSSFFGFLLTEVFESGVLESPLTSDWFKPESHEGRIALTPESPRKLRLALGQLKSMLGKAELADCLAPLEAKLRALYQPWANSDDDKDPFQIPQLGAPAQTQMQQLLQLVGALVVSRADSIWPRDTWPCTLTRETGFTVAGRGIYTGEELQKLLASDQAGPLANSAAGALLARFNAPLSEKFLRRALEQNSLPGFQNDLATLLAPETLAGQLLGGAFEMLSKAKPSDITAMGNLLGLDTNFLQQATASLSAASNRPPAEVLGPVLAQFWEPLLKPKLESELKALLVKVEPPKTAEGAFQRAVFILKSPPKPEDIAEAAKLLQFAAENGYAKAQMNLASMYEEGQGVPHDEALALKWFIKAAEQNEPHAGCRVADFYAAGRGVRQDPAEALKWYQREATNGCERSQFRVGQCLEQKSNIPEALSWYRRAATNGFPAAQSTLGERLGEGLACPPNYPEAYLWYRVAAERGDRVAAVSAKLLRSKLSPEQLETAETEVTRLVKLLRQKPAAE